MNYTWLKLVSIFLTVGVIVVGILQFTKTTTNTARIDINLVQPGPAPPPQFQYIEIVPTSPEYYPLPLGYPPEYYRCPQLYFYYEPHNYFYRPGISIFIGCGWWYTPGVGLINIGFYHPAHCPFPAHSQHIRVVTTTTNISSHNTTINITKINNVNPNPNNAHKPPPPPHPNQPHNPVPPHKDPPKPPPSPPHKDPPKPPHKDPPPKVEPKKDEKKKKEFFNQTFKGTWVTKKNRELDGTMTGVVSGYDNDWKGNFTGIWGGRKFTYNVAFTGTLDKLQGTATVDGADYVWTGQITNEWFTGEFTSRPYKGSFKLKKQ